MPALYRPSADLWGVKRNKEEEERRTACKPFIHAPFGERSTPGKEKPI